MALRSGLNSRPLRSFGSSFSPLITDRHEFLQPANAHLPGAAAYFPSIGAGCVEAAVEGRKEDPERFREKMGEATRARPGDLIWMHAVGLGELLALRPLITALQKHAPGLNVLLPSSARSSAKVIGNNLPANTHHQMLPLDAPKFFAQFLTIGVQTCRSGQSRMMWLSAVHTRRTGVSRLLMSTAGFCGIA